MKKEFIKIKVDELIPYENNPRINENAVPDTMESIRQCENLDPIEVDENNVILSGHTRLLALKRLGYNETEVVRYTGLTEDQKKKYRILANKVGEKSGWDFSKLEEELADIDFGDFDFGFNTDDNSKGEETEITEDEPPVDVETKCKLGDLWLLGNHRLICGDSTDIAVIDRLMDGVKADCVFTDPPYGMKKESEGVLNDNLNYDDLLDFNRQWIPLTFGALKDNGSWYCWGIDEPLMDIYSNILKPMQKNKQIAFRNLITWDKGSGQGQLSEDFRMYPIADEKCLFVMAGGDSVQGFSVNQEDYSENMDKVRLYLESEIAKLNQSDKTIANALGYKDGRTVNHWRSKSQFALPTKENYEALREYGKSVLKDYDFLKKDYDELKKDFYEGRSYFNNTHDNMNNVWHFDRTSQEERKNTGDHATPKPIALCSRAIKSSSREGEIVLDVFGGSGSTLIACEQLNRKCYMCELDPHYIDVIIQRYINLKGTDKDVFLLRDGQKIPYNEVE